VYAVVAEEDRPDRHGALLCSNGNTRHWTMTMMMMRMMINSGLLFLNVAGTGFSSFIFTFGRKRNYTEATNLASGESNAYIGVFAF